MATGAVFEAADLHVGGACVRVVTAGFPPLAGGAAAMLARLRQGLDLERRRLMHEPWGFGALEGVVLGPSGQEGAPWSLAFMDQDGYGTLCGRGLLAAASLLLRTGRAAPANGEAGEAVLVFDTAQGSARVAVAQPEAAATSSPVLSWTAPPALVMARLEGPGRTVAVVRAGEALYAVAEAPGRIDLDPLGLGGMRDLAAAVRRAAADAGLAVGRSVLWHRPPSGTGPVRVLAVDAAGRLSRAAGPRALSAVAAARAAAEGNAAAFEAVGLADDPVRVTPAAVGDGGVAVTVTATPHLVAWRRFFVDPDDAVAPFVVP